MSDKKFENPVVGVTAAFKPCSECYEIIEREALIVDGKPMIRPGSRFECFACSNVLQAAEVVKSTSETPLADRYEPFKGTVSHHELADFLFSTHVFTENTAKAWLDAHELKGFEPKPRESRERNLLRFAKDEKASVDVYAPVEKGVFGRFASKERNVSVSSGFNA